MMVSSNLTILFASGSFANNGIAGYTLVNAAQSTNFNIIFTIRVHTTQICDSLPACAENNKRRTNDLNWHEESQYLLSSTVRS